MAAYGTCTLELSMSWDITGGLLRQGIRQLLFLESLFISSCQNQFLADLKAPGSLKPSE